MCNSDSHESRLKRLDVHLQNARQHVARNTVALYYVATTYQAVGYMAKEVSGEGMKRPNAILFGNDLAAWGNNTDMTRNESRFLVPLAPIVPASGKSTTQQNEQTH